VCPGPTCAVIRPSTLHGLSDLKPEKEQRQPREQAGFRPYRSASFP
jgi:hypothetical protein